MSLRILDDTGRIGLDINKTIKLHLVNTEDESRTFKVIDILGCGATAIVYKVNYDGADNNRYLYVLKELYPVPVDGVNAIAREAASLDIDSYDNTVRDSQKYSVYRKRFEETYRLQNKMANGEDAVTCMTTSLPIGLYEDRASSKKGNYAVYGLFQYLSGQTLKQYNASLMADTSSLENKSSAHTKPTLLELINIQQKVAEVVKSYHDQGYLWFDIKEANVNIVGAGSVISVSMFDFGSLILKEKLKNYKAKLDQDFILSFSPTSTSLLLPNELETLVPEKQTNDFVIVDARKHEKILQVLGNHGERTDIFLLGSLLFKQLAGEAPTKEKCENLENNCFDMGCMTQLHGYPERIVDMLKTILKNSLHYEDRNLRYKSVSEYMSDLKEVYLALCTLEGMETVKGNVRGFVTYRCNQYLKTILSGDADGKFKHLKQLQGRFESRVSLRSDQSRNQILPSMAIDNASPVEEGSNRLVFLYGDGGMGKSTALYDYMRTTSSLTPIYIELSLYKSKENDTSFIFSTIFNDICNQFNEAVGYIKEEEISRVKDMLRDSLTVPNPNDPRPQYVLLLDGYNEISRENRGVFDGEIAKIIDTWKNCRIVITGRTLPRDFEDKEIEVYKHFSRYEFVGISEEERMSLNRKKYPERVEQIQRDERLWDILRIPMFMGMYIQFDNNLFNSGQAVSIHTRGEILDHFIMGSEVSTAIHIANRQTQNAESSAFRRFIVRFSLPFIANQMDEDRSFYIAENKALELNDTAWSVFYSNDSLRRKMCSPVPNKPVDLAEFDKQTKYIIKNETGYFYTTPDGNIAFTHQYFRDYFAAKHIQNILNAAQTLGNNGFSKDKQLQFTKDNGLDYTWSDEVCILLGEIIGDYKNEPGYSEE